jgi:putative Holliday junction resolvase
LYLICGGGGIRTHGPVSETPVFKTGAIDHSATPPVAGWYHSFSVYARHVKYIGVDIGTKKVGIAVSDDGGTLAFPKETIPYSSALSQELRAYMENVGASEIVIGRSLDLDMQPNAVNVIADTVEEELRALGVTTHRENEHFTSMTARQLGSRDIDASAAALILQSFLDKSKPTTYDFHH